MATPKRTPAETWKAIEGYRPARTRSPASSRSPRPRSTRASAPAGTTPPPSAQEGAALGASSASRTSRSARAWQVAAAEGLARDQARFERRAPKGATLSRDELLAQIAIVRKDPRLVQPAAVMFRNRKTEEASVEELRAMLEELEALADGDDSDT